MEKKSKPVRIELTDEQREDFAWLLDALAAAQKDALRWRFYVETDGELIGYNVDGQDRWSFGVPDGGESFTAPTANEAIDAAMQSASPSPVAALQENTK